MNSNIKVTDLNSAEKKVYNEIALGRKYLIYCATDCDAALEDSQHWRMLMPFYFATALITYICLSIMLAAIEASYFDIGMIFLVFVPALCIFGCIQTRNKIKKLFPRAIMAYKNERFSNEINNN